MLCSTTSLVLRGEPFLLRMVRSKEFIDNFQFRVIDGQMGVVVVVIFTIKDPSQNPGRPRKSRVSTGAVHSVQTKVRQMRDPVRRKEEQRQGERRDFHDGVLDKAVVPRRRRDHVRRGAMVPPVERIEPGVVQGVVNRKRPTFAEYVAGQQFGNRHRPVVGGTLNGIDPETQNECH